MSNDLSDGALVTILVAAIAIPYVGYLINGEMRLSKDPRGMSGTGLTLGGWPSWCCDAVTPSTP